MIYDDGTSTLTIILLLVIASLLFLDFIRRLFAPHARS